MDATTYNRNKVTMTDGSVYIIGRGIIITRQKHHIEKTSIAGNKYFVNPLNGFAYRTA